MKKFFVKVILILWLVMAAFVTICLFKYNDNKVTQFGDNLILLLDEGNLSYSKNQLFITKMNELSLIKGDSILFFDAYKNELKVKISTIKEINDESSYMISEDKIIDKKYVISKVSDAKSIPLFGNILSFLESKIGYLIFIVLPSICLFMYESYEVISEIKRK